MSKFLPARPLTIADLNRANRRYARLLVADQTLHAAAMAVLQDLYEKGADDARVQCRERQSIQALSAVLSRRSGLR